MTQLTKEEATNHEQRVVQKLRTFKEVMIFGSDCLNQSFEKIDKNV